MSTTLNCQLLSASAAAYGIGTDGSFTQRQPYYDNVGFTSAPTVIMGGPGNINAALVGVTSDSIIVAFRGTLPPSKPFTIQEALDWLQDFLAAPQANILYPGEVHSGFAFAMITIWADVLKAVQALRQTHINFPIQVTGHSKGGALASLAAWQLNSNKLAPSNIVTFASPHAGNADFATAYNKALTQVRFENYLDIIPFLPPQSQFFTVLSEIPVIGKIFAGGADWNYMPVGNLQYITKAGSVIGDEPGLSTVRLVEITAEIATGNLGTVFSAHSITTSGGYCRGICPSSICTAG